MYLNSSVITFIKYNQMYLLIIIWNPVNPLPPFAYIHLVRILSPCSGSNVLLESIRSEASFNLTGVLCIVFPGVIKDCQQHSWMSGLVLQSTETHFTFF